MIYFAGIMHQKISLQRESIWGDFLTIFEIEGELENG
jgi:hypothetical protein